jgi:CO/xanthine dehydrogenase FAD-binding subunit
MASATTEVLTPTSEEEAIAAFGDGTDVVVVGGGTIVVPDLTYRKLEPKRALMLGSAGLSGVSKDGSRVTIGATTPVQDLVGMSAPVGPCAANVADLEIRSQATVGGNICAGEGYEAPRGDLQGAFLALGATARSAVGGEVTEEPLEDFLPKRSGRLLLSVSFRRARRGRVRRPRPAAHARLHRALGLGRAQRGRHPPPRSDGRRLARPAAPVRRGRRRRRGAERRDPT